MSLPQTYKKVVVHTKVPDYEKATKLVEVPLESELKPTQVLIKVIVAGCQASDIIQIAGGYGPLATTDVAKEFDGSLQIGDSGCEGVGIIVKAGEKCKYKVNQTVCWSAFGSAFREFVILDEAILLPTPNADPQWVAIPVSAMTAVAGLEFSARLQANETVLVTAASGGTGQFAVQWAKFKGCRVAGTCGTAAKAAMLRELGCDVVINYREDDVGEVLKREFPKGVDVIYESVGGELRNTVYNNLAHFGRLIIIGSVAEDYTKSKDIGDGWPKGSPMFKSVSVGGFFLGIGAQHPDYPKLVGETMGLIMQGKMKVIVDSECEKFKGIESVKDAQQRMRSGKNVGKIYARIAKDQKL